MAIKVVDGSHVHGNFDKLLKNFMPYAQQKLGYDKPVDIQLVSDPENAKDPLGKTAYYDPNLMRITVFVDRRHVKDILRSLSHELVHHKQNCEGKLADMHAGEGYAQKDPVGRKLEAEAYLEGSGFLLRDWEDNLKGDKEVYEQMLQEAVSKALKLIKEQDINPMYAPARDVGEEYGELPADKKESLRQALLQNDRIDPDLVEIIMNEVERVMATALSEGEMPEDDPLGLMDEALPRPPIPPLPPEDDEDEDEEEEEVVEEAQGLGKWCVKMKNGKTQTLSVPMQPTYIANLADDKWALKYAKQGNQSVSSVSKGECPEAKNTNENWARAGKDKQLFEELLTRWCK